MKTILQVQWPNAQHELLANPTVSVTAVDAGGSTQRLAGRGSAGKLDFEIPDATATVKLFISFGPSIGGAPIEVLNAAQDYAVSGTLLTPVPNPAFGTEHPLVVSKSVANAVSGATIATIRTEFVDITSSWLTLAANASEYEVQHEPGTELTVLGYTGGKPLIWMAVVPKACLDSPSDQPGALVFYRPAYPPYSKVEQTDANKPHNMYSVNRYLLAPQPGSADLTERDKFTWQFDGGGNKTFLFSFLYAGFERTLANSGKRVVLLKPLPNGTGFGDASASKLPALCDGIFRFLRSMGALPKQTPATLGRLGLSGYSAGGFGFWGAFDNNKSRVREVYSFDPRGTDAHAATVIQWASKTDGFRLRLTGEERRRANLGIIKGIEKAKLLPTWQGAGDATASPLDANFWATPAQGGSPWWDFCFQDASDALLLDPLDGFIQTAKHQFALFGGTTFGPAGAGSVTYLEDFLKNSGY